jgi:predicted RNase H-like HicB family nuclease
MKNEFTAIIERDGQWFIAFCPEIPGANGQGRTKDEARESLAAAIELILQDRREDALHGIPPDAIRELLRSSETELIAPTSTVRLLP